MRIVVLGATGGTGASLVDQALAAGHEVVVVARRPEAVPTRPGLTVLRGSVTDVAALTEGFTGADVVVNVVGVSGLLQSRKGTTVYSAGGRAVVAAMRAAGVRRLVTVTSGGVVDQPGDGWFYRNVLKRFFLEPVYLDMRVGEQVVRESGLDWTIVRPSFLLGAKERTDYRTALDVPLPDDGTLSRWSLAHLLLREASTTDHTGRVVFVSY